MKYSEAVKYLTQGKDVTFAELKQAAKKNSVGGYWCADLATNERYFADDGIAAHSYLFAALDDKTLTKLQVIAVARAIMAVRSAAPKTPRKLILTARRWFDRPNGNTYFSASAELDGETVANIACEVGYDDHWLDRICEELNKNAVHICELPAREKYSNGRDEMPRDWLRRVESVTGIAVFQSVTDVNRKRDL